MTMTADTLVLALVEAGLAETDFATSDAVALVLVGNGVAAVVMPLRGFLASTLVVTWPVRTLTCFVPAYTLTTRTTGWPYTLVQKVGA